MTILERKAEFIRQVLTETDDSKFERLEKYFKRMESNRLPGQATVEEMRESVNRAMNDYENGQKNFFTQDELRAKFGI